jgi:branched-chain amino acid transport system substrate-binding protein
MGWLPNYRVGTQIYAEHILRTSPIRKIGVLCQNDAYGKDFLKGLKDGLGDRAAKMIVAEVSYESTDAARSAIPPGHSNATRGIASCPRN